MQEDHKMSVEAELEERLQNARDHGLVHVTRSIANTKARATEEDVDDHLIVLNNILRIRATNPKPAFTL
jgi:hypothetical protein